MVAVVQDLLVASAGPLLRASFGCRLQGREERGEPPQQWGLGLFALCYRLGFDVLCARLAGAAWRGGAAPPRRAVWWRGERCFFADAKVLGNRHSVCSLHQGWRQALPPAWGRGRARLPGGQRCGRAAPVRGGGCPGCQPRPPGKGCRRAGPRRRAVGESATGLRC